MSAITENPQPSSAPCARPEPFDFDPPKDRGLRRRTSANAGVAAAAQGLKFLLRLVSMTYLARLLSPDDYGIVGMATAVTSVLGAIREAGLSSATIQRPKITHEEITAVFWLNVALGGGVAVICVIVGPVAGWSFHQPALALIIPAFGVIGWIGSLSVQHSAILQRKMEFGPLMIRDLVGQVVGVAAGIAAARSGAGFWSLIIMEGTSVAFSTLAIWFRCKWRPGRPTNLGVAKPLVQFGAKVTGAGLLHHASRGIDGLVIGGVFGTGALGLFGRAQQLLSTPMAQIVGPLMSVARPALSRAAESPERLSRATTDLLRIVSITCAFVVAVLVPVSDGVIALLLGNKWLEAAPIFMGLAPFALVEPCGALLASVLVASGHPGKLVRWRLISFAIIGVGLALGFAWGPLGIAVSFGLTGLFIRMPLLILYVAKAASISARKLFAAIVPSVVVAAVAAVSGFGGRHLISEPTSLFSTVLIAGLTAVVYAACTLLTPQGRRSLAEITSLLQNLFSRKRVTPKGAREEKL